MTPPAPQTPPDPKAFPYSEAQQKAIQAGPNPVLVLAGPGSGKTRTLVGRVQRLLKDGIPAQRILAVTFTRRAAAELLSHCQSAFTQSRARNFPRVVSRSVIHRLPVAKPSSAHWATVCTRTSGFVGDAAPWTGRPIFGRCKLGSLS